MPLPVPDPRKFSISTPKTEAEKQRIKAARLAMFNLMLKDALDG